MLMNCDALIPGFECCTGDWVRIIELIPIPTGGEDEPPMLPALGPVAFAPALPLDGEDVGVGVPGNIIDPNCCPCR